MARRTKQIERPDLVAVVTERIRRGIFAGDYPQDKYLPSEGELAEANGVSRNVVREAMRNLRTLGLVETSQGRRPRVKAPGPESAVQSLQYLLHSSKDSLEHLLEVRLPLETEIAGLAAQRAEPSDLEALASAIDDLAASKNPKARVVADIAFHGALALSAKNPLFPLILDTVTGLLHGFHDLKVFRKARVKVTVAEHRRILGAVKDGDVDGARAAMREHLEGAR